MRLDFSSNLSVKEAPEYIFVGIKYSVCELICDVINVFEPLMGKISVYEKVVIKKPQKRKFGNRKFYISLHL